MKKLQVVLVLGFFFACQAVNDWSGKWAAPYPDNDCLSLIGVTVTPYGQSYMLNGTKITGNENVPAGKLSWWVSLDSNGQTGTGYGVMAETGYVNPTWYPVTFTAGGQDRFTIAGNDWGSTNFFRWYSTCPTGVPPANKLAP